MTNPARELHILFESWRSRIADTGTMSLSSVIKVTTETGLDEVMLSWRLLARIRDIIDHMTARGLTVGIFARQFAGWARVPLSLPGGWNASIGKDHLVNQATLDELEAFALYLDHHVVVFDDGKAESLRTLIERVRALLVEDEGLEEALRAYLHDLTQEIRNALDDENIGKSFDFAAASARLWVAFGAAENDSSGNNKARWRAFRDQVVIGISSQGVIEGVKIAAMLAIEAGS